MLLKKICPIPRLVAESVTVPEEVENLAISVVLAVVPAVPGTVGFVLQLDPVFQSPLPPFQLPSVALAGNPTSRAAQKIAQVIDWRIGLVDSSEERKCPQNTSLLRILDFPTGSC